MYLQLTHQFAELSTVEPPLMASFTMPASLQWLPLYNRQFCGPSGQCIHLLLYLTSPLYNGKSACTKTRSLWLWGTRLTTAFCLPNSNDYNFAVRQCHVQPIRVFTNMALFKETRDFISLSNYLEQPVIQTTKQNVNADKKLDFRTDRLLIQRNKPENTELLILMKCILNSS